MTVHPWSIRRLLVANRGEIARRIFRTAKDLGIETVAVFTDADADAPFVRDADLAVRIGAGPVAESYLSIDVILEAARRSGADAVHPGYGFVSENAEFARRCGEAGLCFVGPSPAAITAMGDKVVAKRAMIAAGVPVVPGYEGQDDSDATLLVQAERVGMPLLVKAVAGGGGRGMRAVETLSALPAALASARSEAQGAFGNGALFLERRIAGARHVEIQIIADQHGNVHHLGERECSVQRRHQKVIEEAPSPAVDAELRARMGAAAVAAAKAIDYVGAGTVEFLLDDDGAFYFLEMNTRLQVEHPVTEWVTGVDLVRLQIDAAQGKVLDTLPLTLNGHAMEARIYCEDPYAGFVPQLGTVALWRPAVGAHVRVDDGVVTGQQITAYYDPMVAKVTAWGRDRDEARRRLLAAVSQSVLLGPVTNRALLLEVLRSETFVAGQFRTDTLDAQGELGPAPQPGPAVWALAAWLRGDTNGPWHSTEDAAWSVELAHGEVTQRVALLGNPRDGVRATVGEHTVHLVPLARTANDVRVQVDGVVRRYAVARLGGNGVAIDEAGHAFSFVEPSPLARRGEAAVGDEVRTPMGGRVVRVTAAIGDAVTKGDPIATVEAMKLEHRVVAPRDGRIASLTVQPGDQVDARQVLATLESTPESTPESMPEPTETQS